ncbi:MAG: hypothetical protein J5854_00080 [Clostridia bacterium]|nr:hypothetical protein [Clostridia bacterium]
MKRFKDIVRSALKPRETSIDVPKDERPGDPLPGAEAPSEDRAESASDTGSASAAEAAKPAAEVPAENNGSGSAGAADSGYDLDSGFSEFYDRLIKKLGSYGITGIPGFDELYGLIESFLRPAIDAAVAERNRAGRENLAELDADAYARGMGGSSYLSSVKSRELDAAASDVMALEGKYTRAVGEYLYKALSEMQKLEADMSKLRLTLSSSGRGGSGSGSSSSGADARVNAELGYVPYGHDKHGAYFDGVWYEGDFSYFEKSYTYSDYAKYLEGLSPSERYLFFTGSSEEWRRKRWQVQYNLPQVDYLELMARFMRTGVPGGDSNNGSGGMRWSKTLN